MKDLLSHPLVARRVRGRWILASLGVSLLGLAGFLLADRSSPAGFLSPFLAGFGLLWFVTLLGARIEQHHQAEKYGRHGTDHG